MYFYDDFFMMMFFIAAALLVVFWMMRRMNASKPSAQSASSSAKPQPTSKTQIAEDIKATKTSRIVDAVSILDDLGTTSSNYRHYCELVGSSMGSSGVIAPYSKRQVAYYDIKCYRIDATAGGGQRETLVAHEHSFDPFFFTDGSCDTPVYIDLESFGDNVILVNSTNHIEGPNSDFAKAVRQSASAATTGGGTTYAMVGGIASRATHVLLGAAHTLRDALAPRPALQPALALAGGGSVSTSEAHSLADNLKLASSDGRGVTSGRGGGRGGRGRDDDDDDDKPSKRRPQVVVHMGYGGMPQHLGDFMGPSHQPYVMGGGYTTRPTNMSGADILLGMSLAALLNSMSTTQQPVMQTTTVDTFRGYRLVENIVPLGSPIYCIGEVYKHGTDIYMSRSLAKDYPTSFFATKPESEVLSAIGAI